MCKNRQFLKIEKFKRSKKCKEIVFKCLHKHFRPIAVVFDVKPDRFAKPVRFKNSQRPILDDSFQ